MKNYSIVGMSHRGNAYDILKALNPGEVVTLVREPRNKYDSNAIAVWVAGTHVGYIPKAQNKTLAGIIDLSGKPWVNPAFEKSAKADSAEIHKAVDGKFVRSPNSGYPMVSV